MIVGLTGKAHAGKDEAAFALVDRLAYVRIALADPLKDAAAAMFGIDRRRFDDSWAKEERDPYWGISPRQMAQQLGTEAGRKVFGDDLWIKRATLTIREHISKTPGAVKVVVPDIRYDNEAEWIRRQGGIVIRITRPGVNGVSPHASENGVSDWLVDETVENDSTIEALSAKVRAAVARDRRDR